MLHKHGGDIYSCQAGRQFGAAGGQVCGTYDEIKDFSANINFRGMLQTVRLAAERAVADSIHYPDPECRRLRVALAERENTLLRQDGDAGTEQTPVGEDGESVSEIGKRRIRPEHIICGNGAAELMFAFAAAKRPRRALLAVPSFYEYEQALAAFGCEICHFTLREEHAFRMGEDFADAIDGGTDCIVLGNPNNPTGRLIEQSVLERIVGLCRDYGILLVLDESFYDFLCEEDRARTFSGTGKITETSGILVMKSFTKIYGMPGLRFGYGLCGDAGLLDRMRAVLQPWNVSLPAQAAAEQAAGEICFAKESARLNRENRARMVRRMEEAGFRVFPSEANFLLFQGPEGLKERCLKRGFLIRDCGNFPGLRQGFYRVCVRGSAENDALVQALADAKDR